MGRIKRGWALTKQSWGVLARDRSLLLFPVLSVLFAVLAAIAIWTPAVLFEAAAGDGDPDGIGFYVAAALTAYVSTFIAIFFNVALAAATATALRGGRAGVGDGISAAMSRLGPILSWTLLATTVGLILKAVENRAPQLGRIAASLFGAAWGIATFFVVPVLALEGSGPVDSLKRSVHVIKARWGESATGAATISALTVLVAIAIAVIGGFGGVALLQAGLPAMAVGIWAVAAVAILVVSLISTALNQIFRVAVYQYAVDGQVGAGFDQYALQAAFGTRR